MSKAIVEAQGDVAVIRMKNGVTNAVNPELIEDLTIALETVKKDFRGMVLAGNTKFFVIGFDVPTLLKLDRPGMADFFHRFNQFFIRSIADLTTERKGNRIQYLILFCDCYPSLNLFYLLNRCPH